MTSAPLLVTIGAATGLVGALTALQTAGNVEATDWAAWHASRVEEQAPAPVAGRAAFALRPVAGRQRTRIGTA